MDRKLSQENSQELREVNRIHHLDSPGIFPETRGEQKQPGSKMEIWPSEYSEIWKKHGSYFKIRLNIPKIEDTKPILEKFRCLSDYS